MIASLVKLGGGVFEQPVWFGGAVNTISRWAASERLVVVPGGGPFADTVRRADQQFQLSGSTAHWMATLAMDQYAHLLADCIPGARLVEDRDGVAEALGAGALPVLAPTRWLRAADPLPHSWDVTSDSIAAWFAGQLGARRLILIKPAGAAGVLVDGYFRTALPGTVQPHVVTADRLHQIPNPLGGDLTRA